MNGDFGGGTGSQTDPFLIEDIYDFVNITTGASSINKYYKLVNNIDFNDHHEYKYGITKKLFGNSGRPCLDGNGKEIRNMVVSGIIASSDASIIMNFISLKNCNFVNTVLKGCTSTYGAIINASASIENCNFTYIMSASIESEIFGSNSFTNCTFNISGYISSSTILPTRNITFKSCHIKFKDIIYPGISSPFGMSYSMYDSYITGRISNTINLQRNLFCYLAGTSSGNIYLYNSYISVDMDIVPESSTLTIYQSGYGTISGSISFINMGLIKLPPDTTIKNDSTIMVTLSDEECKNAMKLNSIGFTVIPVEKV